MNISKSLHKSRKQFASRRKRSPRLDPGSCLGYTSILNAFMIATLVMKIINRFFSGKSAKLKESVNSENLESDFCIQFYLRFVRIEIIESSFSFKTMQVAIVDILSRPIV